MTSYAQRRKLYENKNVGPSDSLTHQFKHVFWVLKRTSRLGKGIMTTVPAWCVSAHASLVFKIDSQKTQCLLIALNKMQLLKKIILYVEVIF